MYLVSHSYTKREYITEREHVLKDTAAPFSKNINARYEKDIITNFFSC